MNINKQAQELAKIIQINAERQLDEMTSAGAVGAVAQPMNSGDDTIRRQPTTKSKKKSKKKQKVKASVYESASGRHGIIFDGDPSNPTIEIDGYASVDLKTLQSMLTRHFEDLNKRAQSNDWSNINYLLGTGVIQLKLDAMMQAIEEIEARQQN